MADRVDIDEGAEPEVEQTEETTPEPEKISLGDNEFSKDELETLVQKGKKASELEQNYGDIDKWASDWGRTKNEIGQLRRKLEENEVKKLESKPEDQLTDEELRQKAKQQARELGLVTSEEIGKHITRYMEAKDLLDNCKNLEGEFDGGDGRPAFKTQDMLSYMQETGIKNPELAYKARYESQLDQWKEKQFDKTKKKGMPTETGSSAGGSKTPKQVAPNKDNLDQLVKQALAGEI